MSTSDTSKSSDSSINKIAKKIVDNIPIKLAKKIVGKSKSTKSDKKSTKSGKESTKSDKKSSKESTKSDKKSSKELNIKFKQTEINQDKKGLPLNIMGLDIRDLITYTLKAYIDLISDIYRSHINKELNLYNISQLILKENRILYIGVGFLLVSIIMYILNNFIKFTPSIGGEADKRVFINNY